MDIKAFRDELLSALGTNLTCLIHHGSRVRGEARANSDYDFALILSKIDRKVLGKIRNSLLNYPKISVYILDKQDLLGFPKPYYTTFLQFKYSERLYGNCNFPKASPEDIDAYVNIIRTEETFTLRHYLSLPHDLNKLAERIQLRLKNAYFCLKYLVYKETGILPKTRLETINYFKKQGSNELTIKILKILENWSTLQDSIAMNLYEYMQMLEEFWRTLKL